MTKPQSESETRQLIGKRFQALRLDSDLTIPEVGRAVDIPASKIRDIETGRTYPNIMIAGILCAFYDAPLEFLLTGKGLNRQLTLPEMNAIILRELTTPVDLPTGMIKEIEPTSVGLLKMKDIVHPATEFKLRFVGEKLQVQTISSLTNKPMVTKLIDLEELRGAVGRLKLKPTRVSKARRKPTSFDFSDLRPAEKIMEVESHTVISKSNKKSTGIRSKTTKPKTRKAKGSI